MYEICVIHHSWNFFIEPFEFHTCVHGLSFVTFIDQTQVNLSWSPFMSIFTFHALHIGDLICSFFHLIDMGTFFSLQSHVRPSNIACKSITSDTEVKATFTYPQVSHINFPQKSPSLTINLCESQITIKLSLSCLKCN